MPLQSDQSSHLGQIFSPCSPDCPPPTSRRSGGCKVRGCALRLLWTVCGLPAVDVAGEDHPGASIGSKPSTEDSLKRPAAVFCFFGENMRILWRVAWRDIGLPDPFCFWVGDDPRFLPPITSKSDLFLRSNAHRDPRSSTASCLARCSSRTGRRPMCRFCLSRARRSSSRIPTRRPAAGYSGCVFFCEAVWGFQGKAKGSHAFFCFGFRRF